MQAALIHVPYWWHMTLLELLWLIGGIVATTASVGNALDAVNDEDILDDVEHDPTVHSRHYLMIALAVRGRTIDHALTLGTSLLIVVAGVIGIVNANPLGGATTLTGFAITLVLDGIAINTALRALVAMRTRTRLYDLTQGRSRVLAAEMRAREITDRQSEKEVKP